MLRQALDAARQATEDVAVHDHLMRRVCGESARFDPGLSPPVIGQRIHRIIRETVGDSDPYYTVKQQFNAEALSLVHSVRKQIRAAPDRFEAALRFAIGGNDLDCGARCLLVRTALNRTIRRAAGRRLQGDPAGLRRAIQAANHIVYLGDNAGEVVFDRLLIEQMPCDKVTYVVRGRPVINDATLEDADIAGLTQLVHVIGNGSDAPGTVLDDCSASFRQEFGQADLIIAKGQGNFESLSELNGADIYFLLIPKCKLVADHIGWAERSFVVQSAKEIRP
jgi:uncharacterized protein with ATP-grasp and redox domains